MKDGSLKISKWSDKLAKRKGYEHICGHACLTRAVAGWTEINREPATNVLERYVYKNFETIG
jgi:hypothetical protein